MIRPNQQRQYRNIDAYNDTYRIISTGAGICFFFILFSAAGLVMGAVVGGDAIQGLKVLSMEMHAETESPTSSVIISRILGAMLGAKLGGALSLALQMIDFSLNRNISSSLPARVGHALLRGRFSNLGSRN